MIYSVKDTVQWLRLNDLKYFVVQLKDTDNTKVFESDDGKPFEENVSQFLQVMELSKGGRFIIKAADSKDSKRGKFFEEFKNISDDNAGINGVTTPPQNQVSNDDIEKLVEKRIKEYEDKKLMQELLEKNKELEKEVNRRQSVSDQFMERAMPYVGTLGQFLLSKVIPTPQPIALAGIEAQQPSNENNMSTENEKKDIDLTDEQTERVEAALQKLAKAEPDFILLLEKIASMAESKDPMFGMAKGILLQK